MSTSLPEGALNHDPGEETLTVLTKFLEKFLDAWDSGGGPPSIGDYLPSDGECRKFALIEIIKVDLELRWNEHNLPKRLTEYLKEFPELTEVGVPADLVYEEYHIRKNCGFQVDPQEYLEQFPDQASELICLLGLEQPYESTALYKEGAKRRIDLIDVGQQLDDFDLLSALGTGAFAKVFLARQRSMQRLVALKVSADSGTEPQTLAQFDHNYIVRVFDQRLEPEMRLRLLYMQYVAGGTLHSVLEEVRATEMAERSGAVLLKAIDRSLEKRGEMRPSESTVIDQLKSYSWPEAVCWLGSRMAQALDYAHKQGVLHRDVKPANVLLTAEGVPKLADFNISFSSNVAGVTPAAYFGGSLAYMSPEQLEASHPGLPRQPDSLDGRSDLYSLGMILWELLTGARPFRDTKVDGGWSKTLDAMIERRKAGITNEARNELPEDCPPGLLRVLEYCLAANPEDRWASGEELSKQLELCLSRRLQDLLHPPERSWRALLSRWPVLLIFSAIAIPNMLAGVFNWNFNYYEIISKEPAEVKATFNTLVFWVNSIGFSAAFASLIALIWFVARGMRMVREGRTLESDQIPRIRHYCLFLGHYVALIGVSSWAFAGLVYPIGLDIAHPAIIIWKDYALFIGDLLICGMIAAAYPFFGVTYFTLRVVYPKLLLDDVTASDDAPMLLKLRVYCQVYLLIAILVPLISIFALSFFVLFTDLSSAVVKWALFLLSGGGAIGAIAVWFLQNRLQKDLGDLTDALAARP